jgi:outer membrane protein
MPKSQNSKIKSQGQNGLTVFIAVIISLLVSVIMTLVVIKFSGGSNDKMAYINTQKLMADYHGMKDAIGEFQVKYKSWESSLDTLKSELEGQIKTFEANRNSMTEKEQQLQIELLKVKQDNIERYRQSMIAKAQEEDKRMTEAVLQRVNLEITKYGDQHGYNIIFGTISGNILHANKKIDITEEIVEVLNSKYVPQ